MVPIYGIVLTITAPCWLHSAAKLMPVAAVRIVLVPLAAAILFIFSDNLLRASAALDGHGRTSPRQKIPVVPGLLEADQDAAGAGGDAGAIGVVLRARLGDRRLFVAGDLRGGETIGEGGHSALARSDDRLAVRRTRPRRSVISRWRRSRLPTRSSRSGSFCESGPLEQANVVITATWFPMFALFAGAPLFLYDRTAAAMKAVRCCSWTARRKCASPRERSPSARSSGWRPG